MFPKRSPLASFSLQPTPCPVLQRDVGERPAGDAARPPRVGTGKAVEVAPGDHGAAPLRRSASDAWPAIIRPSSSSRVRSEGISPTIRPS